MSILHARYREAGVMRYQPVPVLFVAWILYILAMSVELVHSQSHLTSDSPRWTPQGTTDKYVIAGDINIGAILPIHNQGEIRHTCGQHLRNVGAVQNAEALAYALNEVNRDPNILPDITLGAVVLDDCATPETALGQSLHFMPVQPNEGCQQGDKDHDNFEFYDVVAVVGAESSQSSIMVSHVLSRFQLPIISPMSTSNVLSDKVQFPYFMRMVASDQHQVRAILSLLQHFEWSYIAVIYSKGSYGTSAMEMLQEFAGEYGVCIGYSQALSQAPSEELLRETLATLIRTKARITVLFTDPETLVALFRYVLNNDQHGEFVWVGSDGLGSNLQFLDDANECALGSLSLNVYTPNDPAFDRYFETLTPDKTDNPWFHEMWRDIYGCRWAEFSDNSSLPLCDSSENRSKLASYNSLQTHVPVIIDTVHVIANALDSLIKQRCPGVHKSAARKCVEGHLLLQELYNTKLARHGINITFDEFGDSQGRYEVINLQRDGLSKFVAKRVAMWDMRTESLEMNESDIVWPSFINELNQSNPTSSCGRKCGLREMYSFHQQPCCWDCRECSVNEISTDNSTKCTPCPQFEWPDSDSNSCSSITPVHFEWHHPVVIVFAFLSLLGFAVCLTIFVVFVRNNRARLVKATSRELSYMLLGGVTFQYLILLSMISPPSSATCMFNYISFNISFTIVYSPLVTRTNRIYRIFRSGARTKVTPSFISPLSQVAIAFTLIFIQIIINTVVVVTSTPKVSLSMPALTEPYVELACALPMEGLITSLGYNVLLVFVCSYYAFKTRSLPDNFNESRYITLCVYTTLVIWFAFLPTYFLSIRVFHQIILLCSALLLNASVILLCLYIPKIYALYHGEPTITFQYNLKYSVDCPSSVPMSLQSRSKACVVEEQVSVEEMSTSDTRLQAECASCKANNGAVKFTIAPL